MKNNSISNRNIRIAKQIQRDLSEIIRKYYTLEQVGVCTISRVELSIDYAHAKVYFTVFGLDHFAVENFLNKKSGWLHSCLYKILKIHTVPSIQFLYDSQFYETDKLLDLIKQANSSDNQFIN
ncbi:ribosome-binding factor A [Candidatus Kinetoplastibacterium blastocrithidii TCC012E]|uniref:Ribosome-binding factor A n=1 Tax=Candidatus Kinetoplastidibacterium blastocrithidiae TCC012E TaxID=1208922 RepID=M1LWD4_9PROT|nr:30S ribosome-binding factor RbfA [Candidatus Kinetoplastibacterium blastocrithidii]AGF49837.1 ribosome-binding factor A [Candidatus Kinetoplastibacterium blastocrithidii TCC012E]